MALDPKEAALALHRFGFGPRSGSIAIAQPRRRPIVVLNRSSRPKLFSCPSKVTASIWRGEQTHCSVSAGVSSVAIKPP